MGILNELNQLKQENDLLKNTNDAIRWFIRSIVHCRDCIYWATSLDDDDHNEARNNYYADCVCDLQDSDGFGPWDYCSKGKYIGRE